MTTIFPRDFPDGDMWSESAGSADGINTMMRKVSFELQHKVFKPQRVAS